MKVLGNKTQGVLIFIKKYLLDENIKMIMVMMYKRHVVN